MYTQCPECGSVYRITSAHLKQAAGEVQCGECETRFDALDRLSDVFPKSATGEAPRLPVPPEQSGTEESSPDGEEAPSEREAKAKTDDDQSTEPEAQGRAEPDGDDEASAERREDDDAGDERDPDAVTDETQDGDEDVPAGGEEDTDQTRPEEDRSEEAAVPAQETSGDDDEPTIDLEEQTAEHLFALEDIPDQTVPDLTSMEFSEGLPVPTDVDSDEVSGEGIEPPEELTRRPAGRLARWIRRLLLTGAILAAAAYWIDGQRGLLMRNPAIAPWLVAVYDRLGRTVETTWDVGRFRILDSSADLDAGGDLQVGLSFVNEGEFAQPYPVLRIILEDRWGDEIGSRDIQPSDYLSEQVEGRRFAPSERVSGRATVTRPGLEAVGFRLDLCLPSARGPGMDCLSEQP